MTEVYQLQMRRNDRGTGIMKLNYLYKWRDYGVVAVTNYLILILLRIVSSISN